MAALAQASDTFETERLVIREPAEDDLDALFDVYASNPGYLELTEGSGGEPGRFDLEMLQRDFAVARAMPSRHLDGIYLKESGEPIGVLDWMEENPSDGKPWIGLLIVRADRHRQGIASEVFEKLAARLRDRGADSVRGAVIARNQPALALARSLQFEPVSASVRRPATEEELLVLQRRL